MGISVKTFERVIDARQEKIGPGIPGARQASFYFFYLGMEIGVLRFKFQGSHKKLRGPGAPVFLIFICALFMGGCAPNATRSASARAAYSMPGYGAPSKPRKAKTKKYKKPKTVREKSKSGREAAKHRRESLSF